MEIFDGSLSTRYEIIDGHHAQSNKSRSAATRVFGTSWTTLTGTTIKYGFAKLQTNSRLSQNSHLVSVQNKTTVKKCSPPLQPPHCYGKSQGVSSICSRVQLVTRQNFRRHLHREWMRQSAQVRDIKLLVCGRQVRLLQLSISRRDHPVRERLQSCCSSTPSISPQIQATPVFVLLSFHCLLRPAETRHLRRCDVQTFDGSPWTRYLKVYGIVNIRHPKVCRMAGHSAFGMSWNLRADQDNEGLNS